MHSVKIGDKVVCIEASENALIKVGETYTVHWVGEMTINVQENNGAWSKTRFKKVVEIKSLEDAYDDSLPVWKDLPQPTRPVPPIPPCKPSKQENNVLSAFNALTGQDLTGDQLQTLTILLKHFQAQ